MRISVIVPVCGPLEELRASLAALRESIGELKGAHAEVIVAADGSAPDPLRLAAEFGARLVRVPGQRDPATVRQFATRVATGDVLVFVENHLVIRPDTLQRIADDRRREEFEFLASPTPAARASRLFRKAMPLAWKRVSRARPAVITRPRRRAGAWSR